MESCRALQSPTIISIPFSLSRSGFAQKPSLSSLAFTFPNSKRYSDCGFINVRDGSSGMKRIRAMSVEPIIQEVGSKDKDLVFVAGATGKVGSRTVRELLKLGFRVRAGVRTAQKAGNLVQSVKQMKTNVKENEGPVEMLDIVECDLEKRDQIQGALGNASIVICCIGASEKEISDITGPYRIDYKAAENLIIAATVAKVDHFIMVTSLGTNKFGFPAAILNLFWGVLIWKRKAEEALLASGLPYTIVRPGGMERPTDAYKETHNITLSQEDTLFGGQVSNLQVAELLAVMAKNRRLSYCKVVEVIAETTAPLTPMEELLKKIPYQRTPPKEPDVAVKSGTTPSMTISKAPSAPIKKEVSQEKPTVPRPLSPYVAYEDLKPPVSPTPTPPSGQKETVNIVDEVPSLNTSDAESSTSDATKVITETKATLQVQKTRPLSPYVAYEDLKPPVSPTPTPPSGQKATLDIIDGMPNLKTSDSESSTLETTNVITETETASKVQKTKPLSPYVAYDGLKPPTSPTPRAPSVSHSKLVMEVKSEMSGNSAAPPPSVEETKDKHQHEKPKTMPLSPFTMYEDLKPPTSPIPSPRK